MPSCALCVAPLHFTSYVPVMCSHADRPQPWPPDDHTRSLIYTMVEIGHRIANKKTASWVAVTSDPKQEDEAWTKSGLKPIRFPPFSKEEAEELLARLILESGATKARPAVQPSPISTPAAEQVAEVVTPAVQPSPISTPAAEQVAKIKKEYSSTIAFACGAAGTRARWLLQMLQFSPAPLSDERLKEEGVTVDPAFYPYLPEHLRNESVRVDPHVWNAFSALVTESKQALKPLMEIPDDFALPPSKPPPFTTEDLEAKRILAVDAALTEMLTSTTPASMTFEALRDKHFPAQEAALRELCAKHIFFYNHGERTVEFESELMRRVVSQRLQDERHKDRMQLLRKLKEWQKAKVQQVEAEAQAVDWQKLLASFGYGKLAAARSRVKQLESDIRILRGKLALSSEV
jgi:hypothetical protein